MIKIYTLFQAMVAATVVDMVVIVVVVGVAVVVSHGNHSVAVIKLNISTGYGGDRGGFRGGRGGGRGGRQIPFVDNLPDLPNQVPIPQGGKSLPSLKG
jgi:hypothetical protein